MLLQVKVAVKTLRVDAMGHGEKEFMREAGIMITLNHPCIVKLIGVTRGKPMMLVRVWRGGGEAVRVWRGGGGGCEGGEGRESWIVIMARL